MINRIWPVMAAIALVLGALLPSGAAAQQEAQEEARTFVGDIAGLENIGAKFVVVISPERRAVAFLGSRDDDFNRGNAKWYIGNVGGNTLVAVASDGTPLVLTLQGDTITGTLAGGQLTATLSRTGTAGLYRTHVSPTETHVAIVAPDGSWVGMAVNPVTGQLIRTWNSGTGVVEQVANTTAIRVRPTPQAPPEQLELVSWDRFGAWCSDWWC
jgi:hypothetical protein